MKLPFLVLALLLSSLAHADKMDDYDQHFKNKYQALHQLSVWQDADGASRFGEGRLYRRAGVRVLFVKGDEYEMAYQHGRLLQAEIPLGAVPQSANLIQNIIRNRYGHSPVLLKIAQSVVDRFVARKIINNGLESDPALVLSHLGALFGISHATSLSTKTLLSAAYAPEILMILANQDRGSKQRGALPAMLASCTDFASWGPSSANGEFIIGRNLDYPLTTYFDKYPTVIYFDPTTGGQKYMGVTSSGVHNAGLTGYNASGIFLGAHTIPTTDTNMDGKPGFLIANAVLRHARSFDEAIALFQKEKPATGYGYTLVSTREKRAATVELSGNRVHVREISGTQYGQSNHYRHPKMRPVYLSVNQSVDEDSWARLTRVEQVLSLKTGTFSPKDAMTLLADQWDPFAKKTVSHGYTVAVSTTVSSAVVLPDRGKIYVSTGVAPTSHGTFVSFPLLPNNPHQFLSYAQDSVDNTEFIQNHGDKYRALRTFIAAKEAYGYRNDVNETVGLLNQAILEDPGNPNLRFMRGLLKLKQAGSFDPALQDFQTLDQVAEARPRLLAQYFKARIYAHRAQRQKAKSALLELLGDSDLDSKLKEAAQSVWNKLGWLPRVALNPNSLTLLMQQSDLPSY